MSELIDRRLAIKAIDDLPNCYNGFSDTYDKSYIIGVLEELQPIDAVPIKFIDEVIEYLTKCRDYAIHEETKTSWDEQRQTLIMLLHEWDAWVECGRTGKYGEWKEE